MSSESETVAETAAEMEQANAAFQRVLARI